MYLDQRTKKILKVVAMVAVVFVLAGCTANIDANGQLLADRAINESTPWTLKAGIFDFLLTIPIAKGILWLSNTLGSVGAGVVIMTVLINIIILPVMAKSTIATQKMQMIQPELDQIQRKYAGRKDQTSQMRMSAEMQALYKKHDISMFSSLTTFITLPIMFAMYHAVQRLEVLYQSSMFGLNLGDKPLAEITSGHFEYIAIIILVGLTQYFAIEITNIMAKRNQRHPNARVSQSQKQMKQMNVMMTIMIVYFALSMPTAMSLYWITTNIVTLARTVLIQFLYMERKEKK